MTEIERFRRLIHEAENPKNMTVGLAQVRVDSSQLEHLLRRLEQAEAERDAAQAQVKELQREQLHWRQIHTSCHAERDELQAHLATLTARLAEAREALTELARWKTRDGDCWCNTESLYHSPGCQKARAVLAKMEGE